MSDQPVLRVLAALAAPHGGCLNRALLAQAGVGREHERSLVVRGALAEVLPRVFVVGGAEWVSHEQLRYAGLLTAGTGGRLAGRSALEIRGAVAPEEGTVHVSRWRPSPQPRQRLSTGVPVVETGRLGTVLLDTPRVAGSSELVRAWPIEPTARSIRQLAAEEGLGPVLTRAWREADFLGLLDAVALRAELGRGRSGAREVRAMLLASPPQNRGTCSAVTLSICSWRRCWRSASRGRK